MKSLHTIAAIILFVVLSTIASGAAAFSDNYSDETASQSDREENRIRTMNIVQKVEQYMRENDAFVGLLSRRGAGDPKTGVSDTDNIDLTGMAHTGFIVRNGFGRNAGYITLNLVRKKGAKKTGSEEYDLSVLKLWGVPHFFIGSFEKDAIVFLPEKKLQLKLWNLLQANGTLKIDKKKRYSKDSNGRMALDAEGRPRYVTDLFIKNGIFTVLHNPEYNLLSDYAEPSTQNCNEIMLKTYIGVRDHHSYGANRYNVLEMNDKQLAAYRHSIIQALEANYTPGKIILSRTKSSFAHTQNIIFGERYRSAPTLFGLKLQKERFDVVSVDSFCSTANRKYLNWSDFAVFRESYSPRRGWFIRELGHDYIKTNRFTGIKNKIAE